MEHSNVAETVTVVGSGGSILAGATTSLLAAVQAAGILLPTAVVSATGLGAFVLGGIGAFVLKDRILTRAEKDAHLIDDEPQNQSILRGV